MERNKKVRMDMKSIAEKVKEHYALPPDSRYKGCEYNAKNDTVTIEFEHQTFDMVKEPPVVEKKTEDSGDEGSEKSGKSTKKK